MNCDKTCGPCEKLHSPDWYKARSKYELKYHHFMEKVGEEPYWNQNNQLAYRNIIETTLARTGVGYVGIRTGEIFGQKFF